MLAKRINAGVNHDYGPHVGEAALGSENYSKVGEVNLGVLYQGDKLKTQGQLGQMLLDALYAFLLKQELDPVAEMGRVHAAYTAHQEAIADMEGKVTKLKAIPSVRRTLVGLDNKPLVGDKATTPRESIDAKDRRDFGGPVVNETELEPT